MTFGLSGAHRTGKSTLAKAVAEKIGIPFYDGSSGRIMRELGYNSVCQMEIARRIEAQNAYLDRYVEEIHRFREPFITDRTPLDMAAYMTAEMGMHSDAARSAAVMGYVARCWDVADQLFDTIIFVRPFGAYVPEEGKPAENDAFQMHIQLLIEGQSSFLAEAIAARLQTTDFNERIDSCSAMFSKRLKTMRQNRAERLLH